MPKSGEKRSEWAKTVPVSDRRVDEGSEESQKTLAAAKRKKENG
jgi:hypothetical protein